MKFGISSTLAKKISRCYAQALFDLALEKDVIEKVNLDILTLTDNLKNSGDLRDFIGNPHNADDLAIAVLKELFEKRIDPLTYDFLILLVHKNRLIILAEILAAFIAIYHAYHRVTKVEIVSAVELLPQQVEAICKKLQQRHKHEYFAVTSLDPDLIGGFQIRSGDEVLDFSMKTQLENYRRQVINA